MKRFEDSRECTSYTPCKISVDAEHRETGFSRRRKAPRENEWYSVIIEASSAFAEGSQNQTLDEGVCSTIEPHLAPDGIALGKATAS
jgi:hypothetical protein